MALVVPAFNSDSTGEVPGLLPAVALLSLWRHAARQQGHVRDRVLVAAGKDDATSDAVVLAEAALTALHERPPVSLANVLQTLCTGHKTFTTSSTMVQAVHQCVQWAGK